MPIRASVLRRPASNASMSRVTASSALSSSTPRDPASSAASSMARRGWTAPAPAAIAIAAAWTSRMSAASTSRSQRPRSPAAVSAAWTAPTASTDGMGSRSMVKVASEMTSRPMPRRADARARAARRSSAASRPESPAAPAQVASRRRVRIGAACSSPSRSATNGRSSRSVPAPRSAAGPGEDRCARPELDPAVDDRALALGIDGRVGDLCEGLAKVVGDRSVGSRQRRRRRVVAHAPERLVAVDDHGPDVEPEPLGVEPGQEPTVRAHRCRERSGHGPIHERPARLRPTTSQHADRRGAGLRPRPADGSVRRQARRRASRRGPGARVGRCSRRAGRRHRPRRPRRRAADR